MSTMHDWQVRQKLSGIQEVQHSKDSPEAWQLFCLATIAKTLMDMFDQWHNAGRGL